MVRILTERIIEGNMKYIEAAGLSTDTKPTANLVTGSKFTEVDTGDVYLLDEKSGDWAKVAAGWVDPEETPAGDG